MPTSYGNTLARDLSELDVILDLDGREWHVEYLAYRGSRVEILVTRYVDRDEVRRDGFGFRASSETEVQEFVTVQDCIAVDSGTMFTVRIDWDA